MILKTATGDLPHNGESPVDPMKVELVGFEPTSAQGNHVLSTRLSQPLVSSDDKTWATNHRLIP